MGAGTPGVDFLAGDLQDVTVSRSSGL